MNTDLTSRLTQGTCLHELKGPDVATALSGAEGRGRGLELSPTGDQKDAAAPASALSSHRTQPREAGGTSKVQVRPAFLPRLSSSLAFSRPT